MAEDTPKAKSKRPTAQKRDIQNAKKALQHKSLKSKMKTAIRSFEQAVSNKEKEALNDKLNLIYSLVDKGIKKKIFKPNKASRIKSTCQKKAAVI